MLRGSSHAWRHAAIGGIHEGYHYNVEEDEDDEQTGHDTVKQLDTAAVLAWFTSRPGCAVHRFVCT